MPLCAVAQTSPTYDWAHATGRAGSSAFASPLNSAVDAAGNIYTTGYIADTMDFDPGPATAILNAPTGYASMYVTKSDAAGNLIWAKCVTGTSNVYGYALAVNHKSQVIITGAFQGSADFDPGAGITTKTAAGGEDYFMLKLDATGNYVSSLSGGGPGTERGVAAASDAAGNIYVALQLHGSSDIDMSIIKFDTSGISAWTAQVVGPGQSYPGNSLAIDKSGNVYIAGYYTGMKDFDPGSGTDWHTATGSDAFILKLTGTGVFDWVKTISGSGSERGNSITVDPAGSTYTCGNFTGTATDFDPGTGSTTLTSTVQNGYVLKLNPAGNFTWVKKIESTNSLSAKSIKADDLGNVYIGGEYNASYSLPWAGSGPHAGASSISDVFLFKMDTAGALGWNGTLTGTVAADYNYIATIAVSTGGSLYGSCAFQGTIDFDPGSGVAARSSSTSSRDIALVKLKQCFLNDAVSLSGTTLTAAMTGVTYQWIDCAGNTPVGGSTSQTFTPAISGSYAVVVTSGSCTDTSACSTVTIPTTFINEHSRAADVTIFPNPATEAVTIGNVAVGSQVKITDVTGKTVYETTAGGQQLQICTTGFSKGLYIVRVTEVNTQTKMAKLSIN